MENTTIINIKNTPAIDSIASIDASAKFNHLERLLLFNVYTVILFL